MGYSPFNLTTLQLPAPTSNMTKVEYKDAYGIDLDDVNIKAFKLVLFAGEKYAIDQIKEVEDGVEIYFNGRIMSITDSVEVSDEVYNVANSTPIYCHPVALNWDIDGTSRGIVEFLLFNNVSTPYASWDDLVDLLKTFSGTIMLSGAIHDIANNKTLIASFLRVSNTFVSAYGMETDGTIITDYTKYRLDNIAISIDDKVNKIN